MRSFKFIIALSLLFGTIALTGCEFTAESDESVLAEELAGIESHLTMLDMELADLEALEMANTDAYEQAMMDVGISLADIYAELILLDAEDARLDQALTTYKGIVNGYYNSLLGNDAQLETWLEELAELFAVMRVGWLFPRDKFPTVVEWYEANFI